MKNIAETDENLKIENRIEQKDILWRDAAAPCFRVHGLHLPYIYGAGDAPVRFRRLPDEVGMNTNEGVAELYKNTAGGRLRFRTDSGYVAIRCVWDGLTRFPHMPATGVSGFDLYVAENGASRFCKSFVPPIDGDGYESIACFGSREMREFTINFPLYNNVASLAIGLEPGAHISHAAPYRVAAPVVYYGSSVTQGGCASRPGNSYPAMISRMLDIDHINLGFSGSGRGEAIMAEHIASLEMAALVMDYDHNAPTPEWLERTHYPFYSIVRRAQPGLPIICVSRTLNPAGDDEIARRREIIMATVERARAGGDNRIWFADGGRFFTGEGWDACTVDGVHPNDLGFHRMAQALAPMIALALGI